MNRITEVSYKKFSSKGDNFMGRKNISIKTNIHYMQAMVFIPVILMIGILLYMMSWQSSQYRQSIHNLTMATEFNFDFKSNIDYKMYRIVIGADKFKTLDPYQDISDSKELFSQLRNSTEHESSKKGLDGILVLIDLLEERIKDIELSNIFGDYDVNMKRLDNDIYIITDLIEEAMSDYIYSETKILESVRLKLDNQIRNLIIICSIVSMFLITFLILSFSSFANKITDPIVELYQYTKEIAKGGLKVQAPKSNIEEIRMLSEQYDQMIIRIDELITHIREEQERQRKTELKLLQSQLNPHFLYNTLDTIVWLAEGKRHREVVEMITALSSFLRIGLNKGNDFISIKEEAEHVRSYLQIQHFRYEDIMDYEIDFDEEIKSYTTLKLTLQPIVENALYHGIKNKREKGFLKIKGWEKNNTIYMQVKDNGIGMKTEELRKMQRLVRMGGDEIDAREGFGIANVAERIRLNYGAEYGLTIESEYGVGTLVTVKIPAYQKLV